MKTISALAVASWATISFPAAAQQFGRMTAADWAVFETETDNRCAMNRGFEGAGETEFTVFFEADGTGTMLLDNGEWSIQPGDNFELFIRVGSVEKVGRATGFRPRFRGGFMIGIPDETFLDVLAGGRSIQFWRKNGQDWLQVDGLQLDGSREAVRLLKQCLRQVRSRLAREEADRRRLQHIPRDPFARPEPGPAERSKPESKPPFADVVQSVNTLPSSQPRVGARSSGATEGTTVIPPTPAMQIGGSLSHADYPAGAIAAGAQGVTRVSIQVGANGLVTGCSVTGSSGSSELDSWSCSLIQRRFRYRPATRNGQPVPSTVSRSVVWRLPGAVAPETGAIPTPEGMQTEADAVGIVAAPHPYEPLRTRNSEAQDPPPPADPQA